MVIKIINSYLEVHWSVEGVGNRSRPTLGYCIKPGSLDWYETDRPGCGAARCANGTGHTGIITTLRYVNTNKVIKFVKFVVLILSYIDSM